MSNQSDDEDFKQSPIMSIPRGFYNQSPKPKENLSPPNFMVEKILEEKDEKDEKEEKEEKEEELENLENFTYVILLDVNDDYYNNVLFVDFLPYKEKYFKNLKIINVQSYSELGKYSYKNKLLTLKVLDVESVFHIIDYNHFQLENICKQIIFMNRAEEEDATLKSFLKGFSLYFSVYEIPLKRKRIKKYLMNGSYQDDKKDDKKTIHPRSIDEEIKLLGKYINYSLYNMRFIYKIPDDLIALCKKAYNILKNKFKNEKLFHNLRNIISNGSFISILNDISLKDIEIVEKLFAVELGDICRDIEINDKSAFIFKNNNSSYENTLRYYVGDYLDELDLSKSFITGSAITASIFNRQTSHFFNGKNVNVVNHMMDFKNPDYEYNKKLVIDLLYPKINTIMSDDDKRTILDNNYINWKIKVIRNENGKVDINNMKGKAKLGHKSIYFDIKSGADVDIGIDTEDDIEYENIVYKHYNIIKKYYPYNENGQSIIKIRQIAVKNGWNYSIYTDNAKYIPIFRTVELYKSNLRNICTHHMSCVRGCYTSVYGERQFLYTASCLYSMLTYKSPNVYYFLGIKSTPQGILNKYHQRGFELIDIFGSKLKNLNDYMIEYNLKNNISIKPNILFSKNIPFSIFNNWDVSNNLFLLKMPQVKLNSTEIQNASNDYNLIKNIIKNSIGINSIQSPLQQSQSPSPLQQSPLPQSPLPQSPLPQSPLPQSPLQLPQSPLPQSPLQLSPSPLQPRTPLQLSPSPLQPRTPLQLSPLQQSPLQQSPLQQSPLQQSPVLRQQFPLRQSNNI